MAQTFQYPNLVAGTDEWTDWWMPEVGKDNSCCTVATIRLPRPIAQDDIVSASIEIEFDKLDLTADKAVLAFQGTVDKSWYPFNAFTTGFRHFKHDVFDGALELSATLAVNTRTYSTVVNAYNATPVGHSVFGFGMRVDYCGGGRSVRGVSWSKSTRRARRTHGRRQKGRRGLNEQHSA